MVSGRLTVQVEIQAADCFIWQEMSKKLQITQELKHAVFHKWMLLPHIVLFFFFTTWFFLYSLFIYNTCEIKYSFYIQRKRSISISCEVVAKIVVLSDLQKI